MLIIQWGLGIGQSNKNSQATKNYGYHTVKGEKPPSIQKM